MTEANEPDGIAEARAAAVSVFRKMYDAGVWRSRGSAVWPEAYAVLDRLVLAVRRGTQESPPA